MSKQGFCILPVHYSFMFHHSFTASFFVDHILKYHMVILRLTIKKYLTLKCSQWYWNGQMTLVNKPLYFISLPSHEYIESPRLAVEHRYPGRGPDVQ